MRREIDERKCPVCGQDNDCGNVAGTPGSCWCAHELFPEKLMGQVPENLRGKSCICKECLLAEVSKTTG